MDERTKLTLFSNRLSKSCADVARIQRKISVILFLNKKEECIEKCNILTIMITDNDYKIRKLES